ncbi:winged helix-turn-helix domain-containing protein [Actinoallomurus vinaceus]|uniref:winged helix-turn-helix domain-containing protein n=1 Tax=Actinoallomurus vinaceus TaxID=1080074 RepID=UPI0031EDB2E4
MDDLDRDSEVPVYQQIADSIAERIESGELRPRRPIPSEKTLMQAYPGVARGTVRRAVEHLRDRGLVYTVPQRGTYVTPPEDRPGD